MSEQTPRHCRYYQQWITGGDRAGARYILGFIQSGGGRVSIPQGGFGHKSWCYAHEQQEYSQPVNVDPLPNLTARATIARRGVPRVLVLQESPSMDRVILKRAVDTLTSM
jgi:hypothetical protein